MKPTDRHNEPEPFAAARKLFEQMFRERKVELDAYLAKHRGGPKLAPLAPRVMLRSWLGDDGTRLPPPPGDPPPTLPVDQQSPDVFFAVGLPADTPVLPFPLSPRWTRIVSGEAHTLYAHVWNLGLGPAAAARVEFFVEGEDGHPTFHSGVTVDLAWRVSPSCHRVVKAPVPWIPAAPPGNANSHGLRIWVRVSALGDEATGSWSGREDRHVARRTATVVR